MSLAPILLGLVLVGTVLLFGLKGRAARPLRRCFLAGALLTFGGCVGTFGWLGGETSGRRNLFNEVNPFIWSGLASLGMLLLVVAAVGVIAVRWQHANRPAEPTAPGSEDYGSEDPGNDPPSQRPAARDEPD